MFTETVTDSTPFHPLVSYLPKRHFHPECYRLHPFSSSCFISSKTTFSPRGLPAPTLFILLFHIFKDDIFTERITGSAPFRPLVSYLETRHFHREGYRLHPFSSSCFILQKQHFHRESYRLHPFSSSCFISSKTAFSPGGLPAPPLFILLFHIFQKGIFTERVTGSTPFHPLVSYLQRRHFQREGYRLHPFSSSCFISSKRHFHPEGYRLHPFSSSCFTERVTGSTPFSSSCFISSKTACSPRALPAPPLFILMFHFCKNDTLTERVTGFTPFHPLVSYLQKKAFSPRGLRAPPFFILLFHIFKNGIFTETVTGSTPFHPLVSYLQRRHLHREGYRLHPFSSSRFISLKTTFSPRGLPAPPLFILMFHIFKNDVFTARVTGSTPFHPLASYLQKRHFLREVRVTGSTPFHPLFHIFKNAFFYTEKVTGSIPFRPLLSIFNNGMFTERVTGSTPFHPLVSYLQKRRFHREGYRLHPFSSSCFISSKTAFSPRGLLALPLFILLLHIFKNDVFTQRVTGSTPFHPLVSPRELPAPPLFILLFQIFKNDIFTERVTGSILLFNIFKNSQKWLFHR